MHGLDKLGFYFYFILFYFFFLCKCRVILPASYWWYKIDIFCTHVVVFLKKIDQLDFENKLPASSSGFACQRALILVLPRLCSFFPPLFFLLFSSFGFILSPHPPTREIRLIARGCKKINLTINSC